MNARPPPMREIKLTIVLTQEHDTPGQWTSHCPELDIISASTSPEVAIDALAEAIRMTVRYEMKRQGLTAVEVFSALDQKTKGSAISTAVPRTPGDVCPHPFGHEWMVRGPIKECRLCGLSRVIGAP